MTSFIVSRRRGVGLGRPKVRLDLTLEFKTINLKLMSGDYSVLTHADVG